MIAESSWGMNDERLSQIIEELGDKVDGQPGYWEFCLEGRKLVVVTDEHHNRMRCMTAVVEEAKLSAKLRRVLLQANFDRALDAKYATSQDIVWALFTHPLRELTARQFIDAAKQVKALADNYGTSFSSTNIVFDGID